MYLECFGASVYSFEIEHNFLFQLLGVDVQQRVVHPGVLVVAPLSSGRPEVLERLEFPEQSRHLVILSYRQPEQSLSALVELAVLLAFLEGTFYSTDL